MFSIEVRNIGGVACKFSTLDAAPPPSFPPQHTQGMRFSLEQRREKWRQAMKRWEQRTENYRDYGLSKALELDDKYRMHVNGPAGIKKSSVHHRRSRFV